MGIDERIALVYDEDCGFCRWSADRILAWDRDHRLRPVPMRSAEGERLLADMPAERRAASWHLVAPDGKVRSGGAAAGPLFRQLPLATPLAVLAETFPTLTDRAYRLVASKRDLLGRLLGRDRCAVTPHDDAR